MPGAIDTAQPEFDATAGIPKAEYGVYAQPKDTMVAAKSQEGLHALAKALGDISPDIQKIGDTLEQQSIQRNQQQGQALGAEAALKDQGDYKQAMLSGDIPANANPYLRFAAKQQFGHLAANQASAALMADPDIAQVYNNSTDPTAFGRIWKEKMAAYQSDHFGDTHNDLAFNHAFQTMAAAQFDDHNTKYSEDVSRRFIGLVASQTTTALTTEAHGALSGDQRADTLEDNGESLRQNLTTMLYGPHGMVASGLPSMLVPANLTKMTEGLAWEFKDPSIYDMIGQMTYKDNQGHDLMLRDNPDFIKSRHEAEMGIIRSQHTQLQVATQMEASRVGKVRMDVTDSLAQAQEAAGTSPIDLAPFIKQYTDAGLGTKVGELARIQRAVINPQKNPNSTAAAGQLLGAIARTDITPDDADYVSQSTIVHSLANGSIDLPTYRLLASAIQKRDKAASAKGPNDQNDEKLEAQYLDDAFLDPAIRDPATGAVNNLVKSHVRTNYYQAVQAARASKGILEAADYEKIMQYVLKTKMVPRFDAKKAAETVTPPDASN